jgi:hypothetical protein
MRNKAYIKPTKPALVVGIIAVIAMLAFGVFFMTLLIDEGSGIGIGFMIVWIIIVLLIGGGFVYNFLNKDGKNSIAEEISFTDDLSKKEATNDFDIKLRKLEGLYKEALITEAEYHQKREEILKSI